MDYAVKLSIILLVTTRCIAQDPEWQPPYFIENTDVSDEVEFPPQEPNYQAIYLNENVDRPITIAYMNYKGTAIPTVSSIPVGFSELGLEFVKNGPEGQWGLVVNKPQDYESNIQKYIFNVFASTDVFQFQVVLMVVDLNDNAPMITDGSLRCEIKEGPKKDYDGHCMFRVLDLDSTTVGDDIKNAEWKITGDKDEHLIFEVIYTNIISSREMDITLSLLRDLDYEAVALYMFTLTLTDGADNSRTHAITIEVGDIADEEPRWVTIPKVIKIDENVEDTSTYKFEAMDGDTNIIWTIRYTIDPPNEYVEVDESSGNLHIFPIDRDVGDNDMVEFTILAIENPKPEENVENYPVLNISDSVTIFVQDVDDNKPLIEMDPIAEILENTLGEVLPSIACFDIDLGTNAMYDLFLEPANRAEAFLLVPNAGYQNSTITLTIKDQSLLDYEDPEWRQFELTVVSKGRNNPEMTDSKILTITLINWNDESPKFDENLQNNVSFPETIGIDTLITTIIATDRDAADEENPVDSIRYSLVGSTTNRMFAIDETTGVLTTKTANSLNYEQDEVVEIQIRATDTWVEPALHSDTFLLTITVEDVNDERPELSLPVAQLQTDENRLPGDYIKDVNGVEAIIEISDIDTEPRLELAIDWDRSRATKYGVNIADSAHFKEMIVLETTPIQNPNKFQVKLKINEIKPGNTPDFEEFDVLYLQLVLTDHNTAVPDKDYTEGILMISIKDINDNEPRFDDSTYETKRVVENTAEGVIAKIYATDKDTLPFINDIRFFIAPTNNTPDGLVVIDVVKGEISVLNPVDAENPDTGGLEELYYIVTAKDTDDVHSVDANVVIFVVDVNDNAPYLCDGPIVLEPIEEDPTDGSNITQIKGCDNDRSDPLNVVGYSLDISKNPDVVKYFDLDYATGLLTVKYAPNQHLYWHENPIINIYVTLEDNVGGTGVINTFDTSFTLKLKDKNDNKPVLPEISALFINVDETFEADKLLASVTATDLDDPSSGNGKVSISIAKVMQNGEIIPGDMFKYSMAEDKENTINIYSAKALRGFHGIFEIELLATDEGEIPLIDTKTYSAEILKYNFEAPTFIFPELGTIVRVVMGQAVGSELYQTNGAPLPLISATDNQNEKWDIEFSIVSESDPEGNFRIVNNVNGPQMGRLVKNKADIDENKDYTIQIKAEDGGTPDLGGTITEMIIKFLDADSEPFFENNIWEGSFTENAEGMDQNPNCFPPAQYEEDPSGGEDPFPIYYYFHPDSVIYAEFFEVVKTESCINILAPLDAELHEGFEFKIVATRSDSGVIAIPTPSSTLLATVEIGDVNDNPPEFSTNLYTGGISSNDNIDKRITTVSATDPDRKDIITYSFVPGSIVLHGDFLDTIATANEPFKVSETSGYIDLNFVVKNSMVGYVSFKVQASDGDQAHNQQADVNVYIISDTKNRITFTFLNDITQVENHENEIKQVFTDILGYTCNIDVIRTSDSTSAQGNETDCITHFVNEESHEPIDRETILAKGNDLEIRTQLQKELYEYDLVLKAFDSLEAEAESIEDILMISLVVVAVVLSTFIIILIVAFVVRTRTLQKRLDKLSITQYGSQESGINRIGISAPTTNKHALEGSNPVYNNNEITTSPYDDAISVGSGDSDLIGVEDNPEFDPSERRASFNPVMQQQFKNQNGNIEF